MRAPLLARLLVLTLGAALAIAACAPAAPTAPAAPEAQIPRGGTIVVALWQEPTTLAPQYVNQTVAGLVSQVAVEGLADTDNDGNYYATLAKQIPTVANGGVKVSGTKMSVTWELLPGLKWSDGTPLTSADIKFTWEVWMKDPKVVNRAGFSDIESIDLPDATTAVVNYKAIYARYAVNFGGLLPKHLLEKEADISKTSFNLLPLGTGPFKFTEFKAGDSIIAERNPNFRGAKDGKPYLDRIIFKSVPASEVAIAQLKAGDAHAMWNILESQTPDLERDQNVKLLVTPSSSVERIEINTAKNEDMTDPSSVHPLLGDVRVRRALLLATPKQQIIEKLLFGKAKEGTTVLSQGWAAHRNLKQDAYDPKKASQLLDEAGWVKGSDGIRTKGGVRASLTIISTTGNKTREQVEQLLVDEFKQIGVEMKITNQPSSVFLSGSWAQGDPRKRGSYDLTMYASSPGIDPHSTMDQRYTSKNIPSKANNGVGQNYTRIKNPELDRVIEAAGKTLDQEERAKSYRRAQELINENYVKIWLYDRANIDGIRANVGGFKGNVWDEMTWNVEDWFIRK